MISNNIASVADNRYPFSRFLMHAHESPGIIFAFYR